MKYKGLMHPYHVLPSWPPLELLNLLTHKPPGLPRKRFSAVDAN